jgi:hypothetical protein
MASTGEPWCSKIHRCSPSFGVEDFERGILDASGLLFCYYFHSYG